MRTPTCKIAIPVRLPSWLTGDLGKSIEQTLRGLLRESELRGLDLTRLPRGFIVEAIEAPGPLLETIYRVVVELEARVEAAFPVLYHEIGPVWTGTLQAVFPAPKARTPPPTASPPATEPAAPTPPVGAPGGA